MLCEAGTDTYVGNLQPHVSEYLKFASAWYCLASIRVLTQGCMPWSPPSPFLSSSMTYICTHTSYTIFQAEGWTFHTHLISWTNMFSLPQATLQAFYLFIYVYYTVYLGRAHASGLFMAPVCGKGRYIRGSRGVSLFHTSQFSSHWSK
jgi:hypothetical protein